MIQLSTKRVTVRVESYPLRNCGSAAVSKAEMDDSIDLIQILEEQIHQMELQREKIWLDTNIDDKIKIKETTELMSQVEQIRQLIKDAKIESNQNSNDITENKTQHKNMNYDNKDIHHVEKDDKLIFTMYKGLYESNLIPKKDEFGFYYEIKKRNQDIIKFYFETQTAKIDFTLSKIDDLHFWINSLRNFLRRWSFTDFTVPNKDTELSMDENDIIKHAIYESTHSYHKHIVNNERTAKDIYDNLKKRYTNRYSTFIIEQMWENILIDASCSDIEKMDDDLNSMVVIEYNSIKFNHVSHTITNEFINRKIKKCIHIYLDRAVDSYIVSEKLKRRNIDINPVDYIEYIGTTIRSIREKNDIYDIEIKLCNNCQSAFHSAKNCRFRSYLRQSGTRPFHDKSKKSGKPNWNRNKDNSSG
ncbi:Tkp4 protein [Vanderwaltozyma polyspora DSM 70294]|uniref:Tkp4 protein n=1 Tax=Vanderwaltozyma polyspora (strain ATCC 22028 / DSM 70294 / BCRC 21397 / CBS 2163 / NBRC 10782 / NRRL Y-8283 / UCD 57-17) TaxID=436907 RepID=A7TG95_VANPO|nr:Tkp4 protein [Vanderwaltozyma polyspora DSM 70294]EDO18665.1 Tkp4 protein [Vanderwaltozyma polyspora DSM 70294]